MNRKDDIDLTVEPTVTIELFGQPYTFRVQTEIGKAREIADLYAQEVAKVQSQQIKEKSGITQTAILIIAALNIASENVELRTHYETMLQDISRRSADLIRELDARIN